jgi:NAD(P)-dependent dehydrogenase (short-subunit alcohol dehydrogenase family)
MTEPAPSPRPVASRSTDALQTLVSELDAQGADAHAVPTDITDAAAVQSLVRAAEQRFGRIDTFVTAPAVGVYGRIEQITLDEFRRVMEVDFLGRVARRRPPLAGPRMQQSDRPDDGTDILRTPTLGPGSVRGAHADHLTTTSPSPAPRGPSCAPESCCWAPAPAAAPAAEGREGR